MSPVVQLLTCPLARRRCLNLILLLVATGCVSNSGKFDQSPCAGCDFQSVNSIQTEG